MLTIGIVAGEASGDLLGAELIQQIRRLRPDAQFEGIGGPLMREAGLRPIAPYDPLSVMGIVEVVSSLPTLLRIRRRITDYFQCHPPNVFVGIDAPDFNLPLEKKLKKSGIRVAHYVSPSLWAWRRGRIRTIHEGVHRLLVLFPFEVDFYRRHGVEATYVGHPLVHQLEQIPDQESARRALELPALAPILTILPGSRSGEIARLAPDFLRTGLLMQRHQPDLRLLIPLVSEEHRDLIERIRTTLRGTVTIDYRIGQSHLAMAAADALLLSSGTAALEGALLGRPMIVAYRLAFLTYSLLQFTNLKNLDYYSLPNWLAGRSVVPEYIQAAIDPARMSIDLTRLMIPGRDRDQQIQAFKAIAQAMRGFSEDQAAIGVLELAESER